MTKKFKVELHYRVTVEIEDGEDESDDAVRELAENEMIALGELYDWDITPLKQKG